MSLAFKLCITALVLLLVGVLIGDVFGFSKPRNFTNGAIIWAGFIILDVIFMLVTLTIGIWNL